MKIVIIIKIVQSPCYVTVPIGSIRVGSSYHQLRRHDNQNISKVMLFKMFKNSGNLKKK